MGLVNGVGAAGCPSRAGGPHLSQNLCAGRPCNKRTPQTFGEPALSFDFQRELAEFAPCELSQPGASDLCSGKAGAARGLIRHGVPRVLVFEAERWAAEDGRASSVPRQSECFSLFAATPYHSGLAVPVIQLRMRLRCQHTLEHSLQKVAVLTATLSS